MQRTDDRWAIVFRINCSLGYAALIPVFGGWGWRVGYITDKEALTQETSSLNGSYQKSWLTDNYQSDYSQ